MTLPLDPPSPNGVSLTPHALLLALAGGALFGARRGLSPRVRAAAAVGGLSLIGAAASGPVVEAIRRAGTRRRAGRLALSFVVCHPVEVVFGFCRDFENFPRFIGALRTVRDYGDGRSHWCASTPSGGTIEWDAVTTKYIPNRVIAWASAPGSPVETTARLRFVPEGPDTCVNLDATYRVLDGSLADALAALAAPRLAREVEADVLRLGPYLDGVAAVSHAEPVGA
jgi:uncharacterized membrane protein